jgi:hypothetical protein
VGRNKPPRICNLASRCMTCMLRMPCMHVCLFLGTSIHILKAESSRNLNPSLILWSRVHSETSDAFQISGLENTVLTKSYSSQNGPGSPRSNDWNLRISKISKIYGFQLDHMIPHDLWSVHSVWHTTIERIQELFMLQIPTQWRLGHKMIWKRFEKRFNSV